MADASALIDSNLLVYVFDAVNPEKREICKGLVENCWRGRVRYAVSVQNLSEFYVAVTEKVEKPIPEEVAQSFVELIVQFDGWKVIPVNGGTVERAIGIGREYSVHYWDAMIAAAMEESGQRKILTENVDDFRKIPWIEVENPLH
jgi:predicted nucleic acid-binding protein